MLQIIGAVLIILGTAGIGLFEVYRLNLHIETLSGFLSALELMESEIYFNISPLYDICKKLTRSARAPLRPFFAALSEGGGDVAGESFGDLWKRTLETMKLELGGEERQVLLELGSTLGRYDIEGQAKAISYVRRRFEGFLKEAVDVKSKMGRVYGTVGLAAGAAVVIILI
ncbi:stage III sporulation protein AB [Oscillospiraceae bacterium OttesenSCG-928-G22]|nr:stage III sporulation protein AB [Oscillospiraceae bacterium OttesenSCG-928-G22]